jgi:hypothetical protein
MQDYDSHQPAPIRGGAEPTAPPAQPPPDVKEEERPRPPKVSWGVGDSVWGLIGGLLLV